MGSNGNVLGQPPTREVRSINASWDFIKTDIEKTLSSNIAQWRKVDLPHTWNNKDVQSGGDFYTGTGCYKRQLYLEKELTNKRIFIRFEGVGQVADVYINGSHVGNHKGAYAAFCFDITPAVKFGELNTIFVKVNNETREDIIPINHLLFMVYGGIYRSVSLIITDKINITTTDNASPGIYITQKNVNEDFAEICVSSKLENSYLQKKDITLKITVYDQKGKIISVTSKNIILLPTVMSKITQELKIEKPTLWHGRQNPYLYKLTTEVIYKGKTIDAVSQPLGLRYYRMDSDKGFFLNGKPYRLYGVCRHQEWEDCGSALNDEHHKFDLDLMYEIGATSLRLAHYQQAEYVYSYCDTLGFIVWAEIPFVNDWSGAEGANTKQQLKELIRQNYNHPSIFIWGLHNEVYSETKTGYPVHLTKELHDLAKSEDEDRWTVSVNGYGNLDRPTNFSADLQGINRYFGWYEGKSDDLENWIINTKTDRPDNFICISEYGCGANVDHQAEEIKEQPDPLDGQFYPESYQTNMHEIQWAAIYKHPFIWASYVWNTFDFAVPLWERGSIKARNLKGLVTYNRKIRKDSFYWYKANWSEEPVIYITEKRFKERTKGEIKITVYCNLDDLELIVNGKQLTDKKQGDTKVHFFWGNVTLQNGENKVQAVGYKNGKRFEDNAVFVNK